MAEFAGELKIGGIIARERVPLSIHDPRGSCAAQVAVRHIRYAVRPRHQQYRIAIPCPVRDLDARAQIPGADQLNGGRRSGP